MMTPALPIGTETMPLMDAARQLKASYAKATDYLLRGDLDGERDSGNRWHVSVASVLRLRDRLRAEQDSPVVRALRAAEAATALPTTSDVPAEQPKNDRRG